MPLTSSSGEFPSGLHYDTIKQFLESDFDSTEQEDQLENSGTSIVFGKSGITQPTKNSSRRCPRCKTNDCTTALSGRINSYCKSCEAEYAKQRYEARRTFVDEYKMETGCQRCGYREHPVALEFDHIDPLTKKYSIGSQLMSMSWKSLHEEISKCQVLCANCHQIHTHESNHYATRRIN